MTSVYTKRFVLNKYFTINYHLKYVNIEIINYFLYTISENSRKSYVVDQANAVFCNFLREALMNTFSSYEATYWLERISYNFLICIRTCKFEFKFVALYT